MMQNATKCEIANLTRIGRGAKTKAEFVQMTWEFQHREHSGQPGLHRCQGQKSCTDSGSQAINDFGMISHDVQMIFKNV